MSFKEILHKHSSWLIPLALVLIAFSSIAILASTHTIFYNTDLSFHWYRLNELYDDIINHTIPQFDTHTTTPYGLATMTYYPYVTLAPFALLLSFIKRPVAFFYTMFFIITLLGYFISYFSYKTVDDHQGNAVIFTIFYNVNSIFFSYMIRDGDIGVLLAMVFLPLAFFGMINLMRRGHWGMLTIGLSLVIFSHILSAVLLVGFLVIMTLLNLKKFWNWKRIGGLLAAVVVSLMTTALFWGPLLYNMMWNHIEQPDTFAQFAQGIAAPFSASINHTYSLVELLGILMIIFIKKMNWQDVQLWGLGILTLAINFIWVGDGLAKVFPALYIFQFSYRFSFLSHIIFAYLLTKFIKQRRKNQKLDYLPLAILIPILLLTPLQNQLNTKFLLSSRRTVDTPHFQMSSDPRGPYETQFNYNDQSYLDIKHSNYNIDYAPQSVRNNVWMFGQYRTALLDQHNRFRGFGSFDPVDKGIQVHLKKTARRIVLPITVYKGYRYGFSSNGRSIPTRDIEHRYTDRNALLTLKNVQPGTHTFQVQPKIAPITQYSYYLTLFGFLINLLWMGIRIYQTEARRTSRLSSDPVISHTKGKAFEKE